MRSHFDAQLAKLNNEMIQMGALVEAAIAGVTEALLKQDVAEAERVIRLEQEIDDKEKDIEAHCLKLLVQQQPVARDLRQISTALKMITDLERIGDQTMDISELAILLSDTSYIKRLEHIAQMAEETGRMVTGAIDAFVEKDLSRVQSVIAADDIVDGLFDTVKEDLIQLILEDPKNGSQALDLLMIAKYLERIGDHAENIAEWVEYSITGHHRRDPNLPK
ncbi:MAG: phosphate signaling complex protein PhoU [Firmicutes bacterium]|jgi:phosphate transport system protein|nr:phosphate signaling complex protein PhoU [Bacillota bacterium]NLO66877.1 phosphate signaling complex protein PhoU [Bacillota bacterium]